MRVFGNLNLRLWITLAVLIGILLWAWTITHRKSKTENSIATPDLSITNPLNQPGGGAAPADAYEIYSALYQEPMQESLVVAENSETDIPQINGSCLNPSTPEEREMVEAFEAANKQSHRWEQKFSISSGYTLLPQAETAQALTCLETHGQDSAHCEKYEQIKHIRLLGIPGFNHAHTKALVSVIKKCGGFCGSGGIFLVEKTQGKWQRSTTSDFTRDCNWMY